MKITIIKLTNTTIIFIIYTVIKMEVLSIKALWREKKGFQLDRQNIGNQYIFVHFCTNAETLIDNKAKDAKAGACIIYGRYTHQQISSFNHDLVHDWFHADEELGMLMKKYKVEENRLYYPADSNEITKMVSEIEFELMGNGKYAEEYCRHSVERILIKLARSGGGQYSEPCLISRKDSFINLRQYIHTRYAKDWSIEEMAKLANISPSRFFDIYKKIFGISPMQDLINTRIEHAKLLLTQNDCPVEVAAEQTGYKNQYHFIRQFKKVCGVTPGKYKNEGIY